MTRPDRIRIARDQAGLRQLGGQLGAWLDALGIRGQPRYAAELVAEEIATNLVKYGGAEPGEIELRLRVLTGAVELQILDDTPPFDPGAAAPAPPPEDLGTARPGGHGLRLVRKSVTRMVYEQQSDGRNRLVAVIAA